MYYERADEHDVIQYVTHIPRTGEIKRVTDPAVKTLCRPGALHSSSEEEFESYWVKYGALRRIKVTQETKQFESSMTIGDALRLHPRAGEVFAAFHLGGCSHCSINEQETVEEVTKGYGVDSTMLVEALNGLLES